MRVCPCLHVSGFEAVVAMVSEHFSSSMSGKQANDQKVVQRRIRGRDTDAVTSLEADVRRDGVRKANVLNSLLALISGGRNAGGKEDSEEKPQDDVRAKAIHATRRAFSMLENQASTEKLRTWLTSKQSQYSSALVSIISSPDDAALHQPAVASSALSHSTVFQAVVKAVLATPSPPASPLVLSMISRYPDLTVYALRVLSDEGSPVFEASSRVSVLLACKASPQATPAHAKIPMKEYKVAVRDAWISVLDDCRLEKKERSELLLAMPNQLLPYMSDPLRLSDFLTACYDSSGDEDPSLALASLDALFVLISQHGLDYPRFYHKLYALLTPIALSRSQTRHRFLQLTSLFLKRSSRLPAALVAAFVKRLVRRALTAPTPAALWALRLALDLLYAHPGVSFLVHRTVNLFDSDVHVGEKRKRADSSHVKSFETDPFDDTQSDPEKSHADDSSLWELDILSSHLSPAITRLVALFSNNVRNKPPPLPGSLKDYAALSFSDVFQAELKRKAKAMHVAYDTPGSSSHSTLLRESLSKSLTWM